MEEVTIFCLVKDGNFFAFSMSNGPGTAGDE
jgi:hypothetical protein